MLSSLDLETLIAAKKLEIEREKTVLGLIPPPTDVQTSSKGNATKPQLNRVSFTERRVASERNAVSRGKEEKDNDRSLRDLEETIPPDLERYIRRYIGLPVMLKAGEYSPNNPLVRGERSGGDALLGLGEYERRHNTLRRLRQHQYKEYLDQQAKKKLEAKQQAERERREQEEKEREREREDREREELERAKNSQLRRRTSIPVTAHVPCVNKVDTGIQVDSNSRPLSVAVQTDEDDLYGVPSRQLTEAERELSPRSAAGGWPRLDRRRSHGDFDERATSDVKRTNREKLMSDLRHTCMPSIFDADAIHLRNLQAEKEAAARRQFYQEELKNQILEQQRIKEERKSREKLLEQAEMRRLEEQLRMLRVAQEREVTRHHDINAAMKDNTTDYNNTRTQLQREIDLEHQNLLRATNQPKRTRNLSSFSDNNLRKPSKLPFYYPDIEKKPYSTNIPDTSIFSSNYDVDSYLRKNLKFDAKDPKVESKSATFDTDVKGRHFVRNPNMTRTTRDNVVADSLPIPVLRHSETKSDSSVKNDLSDAMKRVDDKWKVPAVQKNILKTLPNEQGQNVSILTQLGSIRRQLQLEQLKLDKMIVKDDDK